MLPTLNQNILKKPSFEFILALALFSLILYISAAFIFCIFLTMLLFYSTIKNTDFKDKRSVLSMMGIAVISRLIVLVFVQYYSFSHGALDIFGDAQDNIAAGLDANDYLRGKSNVAYTIDMIISTYVYNVHSKTLFNGFFFALFGKDIFSLKYINVLAIVLSAWLVYDLTRKIYSSSAAKIAMGIVLFWPTLFLWSITDLKESHFILAIIVILWSFNGLFIEKKVKLIFTIPLIISIIHVVFLRFRFMLPLILLIISVTFIYHSLRWCFNKNRQATRRLIFIALTGSVVLLFSRKEFFLQFFKSYYDAIIANYMGSLQTGGWCYDLLIKADQNYYTIPFFLTYLFNAWFHFLSEPLPWHMYSFSMLAAYPMMLIWYMMLFFSLIGVIKIYRIKKGNAIFPFLVFFILYVTVGGMSVSNIGTAVRFRDVIVPIVAIFASCGLTQPQR